MEQDAAEITLGDPALFLHEQPQIPKVYGVFVFIYIYILIILHIICTRRIE